MRGLYITLSVFLLLCKSFAAQAVIYNNLWTPVTGNAPSPGTQLLHPDHFMLFAADLINLQQTFFSLPYGPANGLILSLPMPDGTLKDFKVWQSHIMAKDMEIKYPQLKTFSAYAIGNPRITAKIDITVKGFHAMIYDGAYSVYINPYSNINDGLYICYYDRDNNRPLSQRMKCETGDALQNNDIIELNKTGLPGSTMRLINGNVLRTYRLALAATAEYAVAVDGPTPTKAGTLSAMITTLNRVNGVYERELAITMQLISNDDTLIFLDPMTQPYSNNNGVAMLTQNQTTIDNIIKTANYDIGHVFSTGGGGIAIIGAVCDKYKKAQGVTGNSSPVGDGFDIDYVAHEMGHQFGASHSYNDNSQGSCSGNAEPTQAYEPGSGSTIMCYAGICAPDDLQSHGDVYFHGIGLSVIAKYVTIGGGATCAVTVTSGNKPAALPAFSASYNIPYLTPFELTAPAFADSVSDTSNTYCWEEWDLGDFGQTFANTHKYGPIFRSFYPDTSRTRVFPALGKLVNNITDYEGEKVPDSARTLTFKLTMRDIYYGIGCVTIPDDSIQLNVINTGSPFIVTAPAGTGITWTSNTRQTVKWDVANTTAAPINCNTVDIYLSIDGGYTYPFLLASAVPNNGIDTITVPATRTDQARVKVKGTGNVFFNISSRDFSIFWPVSVNQPSWSSALSVYPVPARDVVHISVPAGNDLTVQVINTIGQVFYGGKMDTNADIHVSDWPKGIYYICIADDVSRQKIVKSVAVE